MLLYVVKTLYNLGIKTTGVIMDTYGKTILSCYTLLDKIANQLENLIKNRARNSFFDYSNAFTMASRILELGETRKELLYLKEITTEVLNELSQEDKTLISYKYFKIMPKNEDFDHTSRNYFRKQVRALSRFTALLKAKGFTQEWFFNNYLKIAFISGLHQKILNEEGKKHCV